MTPAPAPILRELLEALIGERILLRPLRSGDGAAIFEAVEESRAEIGPWLPWVEKTQTPSDSEEAARRGAARWLLREDLMVGIWDKGTGRYLGGSGLHRIDWTVPAFEIGYWLRTSAWGRGYAAEAVQTLSRFAFEDLEAKRVEIRCDAGNARSRAVPERLGFKQEALLRNSCRDRAGELRDTLIFGLTPDDYKEAKAGWATRQP